MRAFRRLAALYGFGYALISTAVASALPITDLFNTGVVTDDNDGMGAVHLTPGMPDPHYLMIAVRPSATSRRS